MNFCGTAKSSSKSSGRGAQQVEPLRRESAPGLKPGQVRRVQEWRSVPKLGTKSRTIVSRVDLEPSVPAVNAIELCRQARRVRATYGKDRVAMHQRLSQLTMIEPLVEAVEDPVVNTAWDNDEDGLPRYTLLDPDDAPLDDEDELVLCSNDRAFRKLVERTIATDHLPVLRYSRRLSLLQQAADLGIERFEANLIIASVENEMRAGTAPAARRKSSRVSAWVVFFAAQSLITAGFWRLVRG